MRLLDDLPALSRIDRGGMLRRAAALPDQCLDGWRKGLAWDLPARLRSLEQMAVLGMGGSAIGADLLQGILSDEAISRPFLVNRTYSIPGWIGPKTLVLACSYSGNTEETISGALQAKKQGAHLIAVTSGGKLASWAVKHRIPLLRIPQGLPPRSAVGYTTFVPLGALVRLGWVSRKQLPVETACRGLAREIRVRLSPSVRTASNPAKQLADALVGRLPILYGAAGGWEGITYRWRTQIEENAKSLVFHHIFPEATHNEISAWLHPKRLMRRLAAVFLADRDVHPRTLRRMEFTARIIRAQGALVRTVRANGGSRLERMLNLTALGDFASVYLGILYKIDPTPVERVEALKKFMAK